MTESDAYRRESRPTMDFLAQVLAFKKARTPICRPARDFPPLPGTARPFAATLIGKGGISLIAEAKRASPSRGLLREGFDAGLLARAYEEGGASALSVVTEERFFGGDLDFVGAARSSSSLPVLRKDFLTRPEEVAESRRAGADAVLLIASILEGRLLEEMLAAASSCGAEALVEVRSMEELDAAVLAGAKAVGVNSRNLRTLEVDFAQAGIIIPRVPAGVAAVAESGIATREGMLRMQDFGADAALVGTALATAADPCAAARMLLGRAGGRAHAKSIRD